MRFRNSAIMALCVAALSACDDGPTQPVEHHFEYEFTVTGAVTASKEGRPAYFGADRNEAGDSVFAVLMGDDTASHVVMLGRSGTQRPAIGTYQIAQVSAGGNHFTAVYLRTSDDLGLFISEGGTVTITQSTPARLVGTVQFTAIPLFDDPETTTNRVTVVGKFDAKAATEDD